MCSTFIYYYIIYIYIVYLGTISWISDWNQFYGIKYIYTHTYVKKYGALPDDEKKCYAVSFIFEKIFKIFEKKIENCEFGPEIFFGKFRKTNTMFVS